MLIKMNLSTSKHTEMIDITTMLQKAVAESGDGSETSQGDAAEQGNYEEAPNEGNAE